MKAYTVLGLMSGTSLDGVDLAVCSFRLTGDQWKYQLKSTRTMEYPPEWRRRLELAHTLDGWELTRLDRDYGSFLAGLVNRVVTESGIKPDLLASHGHTVFHRPGEGVSLQIGSGATIAANTGIRVVCDFRSSDVALGGHGAPMVPAGDRLLFAEYDACLNLGGFSNISFDREGKRIAFDICPVNTILNRYAERLGKPYDEGGNLARSGKPDPKLLNTLNSISYYTQPSPKTLSREWLEQTFYPLSDHAPLRETDRLSTCCHHIADQLANTLNANRPDNVLVTGGGVLNTFLIELLKVRTGTVLEIPGSDLVAYKEALIFAFLGLLRYLGLTNCFASVTGAGRDSVSGAVYE